MHDLHADSRVWVGAKPAVGQQAASVEAGRSAVKAVGWCLAFAAYMSWVWGDLVDVIKQVFGQ